MNDYKFCSNCGGRVKRNAKFCSHCGTSRRPESFQPEGNKCSNCGSLNDSDARFCKSCAALLK